MNCFYKRLITVAEMIPRGLSVADIGADHAQLAVYLAENKLASHVVIGELADGPYARACGAVRASPARDMIAVRQGNGLQVLDWGEVDCVVLAGMGGDTIVDILSHNWDKAASFPYYVFQPMSKAGVLRQHLASRGWIIDDERLVEEHGHIYFVITGHPGNCPYDLNSLELELGSFILKADDDIKRLYLERYCQRCRRIYEELLRASHQNRARADEYRHKIMILEAILDASQS